MKAAIIAAAAFLAGCTGRASTESVPPDDELWISQTALENNEAQVVVARTQVLQQAIVTGGRLAFDDERVSHVFSPVTGRVTRVLAQLGEPVKTGTPLAAIVSPDVGGAVSDEVKARADVIAARHDFQRQQALFAEKAASSRDFEAAEDNYRKAKAEEERALQRLRLLRSGQIDAVTQEYLLPSHIKGRVVARMVNPGVEVQGQFSGGTAVELFTVGDIDSLWVFADVQEAELPGVHVGTPVEVRVLAYPERVFRGEVNWVSSTLDAALRTARVRCALPNPDRLLKPEMFATVVIEQPAIDKLAIPRDAVVRINDHSFVYVAAGTRSDGRHVFKQRLVRTPERLGPPQRGSSTARLPVMPPEPEAIAVLAGLAEGEEVLVENARKGPDAATVVLSADQANGRISSVVAEERDLPHPITVGGRLTFDDSKVTHVFPPVSGRITRLLAGFGDHVEKGAPLAIILSPDLGSAFSDELKAKADLIAAQHEWKRQREMFGAKASAERDLEVAEDNYGKAKAEYERAKQKTRMLRGGPADSLSQEFVLRSPIEGDVIARMANPGLEVQGQYSGGGNVVELFTIGKIDRLWVLGDAYEMDLPFLKTGAELELTVSGYPGRTFRGNVDWISDTLDPVMRTAKVRCVLPNPEGLLRPEMYGAVRIAAPAGRVVAVPREAVLRVGDETVVFVEQERLPDGSVSFKGRRVITGPVSGGMVPVLDGLNAGERVATRGSIFLLGT